MFKAKKITASTKTGAAPKKSVVPKRSAALLKRELDAKAAGPKPGSIKARIKAALSKPLAKPSIVKSKKGSPLKKRLVVAPTGKLKGTAAQPSAPANLLRADEPAMHAVQAAIDKKGFDILVLDVAEISGLCDRMILCSARSTTHLSSVADAIEDALRKAGQRLLHSDGRRTAEPEWLLLDYGDLMVHVFRQQARTDYQLEEYYSSGKVLAKIAND